MEQVQAEVELEKQKEKRSACLVMAVRQVRRCVHMKNNSYTKTILDMQSTCTTRIHPMHANRYEGTI